MRFPARRSGLVLVQRALVGCGLVLCLCAPSCNLLSKTAEFPSRVLGGKKQNADEWMASQRRLQSSLMRFVDTFNSQLGLATNEFSTAVRTPEGRIQALNWRIFYMTSAVTIGAGPNPNANLLDMLTLVTLGRMVHEDYWMPEVWGEPDQPVVDAFKSLDGEIWEIAEQTFPLEQLQEVRDTIDAWRDDHPGKAMTAFVRLPSYKKLLESKPKEKRNDVFQSVADLLSLDPFEGLAPATREAAELRFLGERTLFYGQRAPLIFQAQAELLVLKTSRLPETQKVVEEGERFSQAAKSFAETARDLPDKLSEELTAQREGLVRDLELVREPATDILAEARTTLDSGKEMSIEVREAIATLDAFVARVSEESTPRDPETPSRPFDVREYGEAAANVAAAARELDQLIARVDEKLPQVQSAVEVVAQTSDEHVDRAVRRVLLAGLVLIGVGSVASLVVRWIAARWKAPSTREASS